MCTGGELFDRITAKGHFTEAEAVDLFSQIMHALNYCHSFNICHRFNLLILLRLYLHLRDLKPENLLFLDESENSPLKIIDFGLSKISETNHSMMTTRAGTVMKI